MEVQEEYRTSIYQKLNNRNQYERVYGISRKNDSKFHASCENYYKSLANKFIEQNCKISLLINCIGFLHNEKHSPEKKDQDINLDYLKKSFEINTIPTALMIKYLSPLMGDNELSIFAVLSAKLEVLQIIF